MQLPILAITGRALAFVAANLFTLFRLTWLPIVALVATQWLIAYALAWASPGASLESVSETDGFTVAIWAALLLEGLALSVVAVAVHRIILFDDRRPGHYFGFPFGRTELFYVLMGTLSIVFVLLLAAVVFVGALTVAGLAAGATPDAFLFTIASAETDKLPAAALVMLGVATIAGYILVVWLSLRLAVWPPAVVANNRLALGEAWGLTKGQAMAMFGLLLLSTFVVLIPMAAVAYVGFSISVDVNSTMPFAPFDANLKYALLHPASPPDPNTLLLEFVLNFLFVTYTIAILSYAYKELKGYAYDVPIDAQDKAPEDGALQPMDAL